jgi:hypothetical protein
VRARPQKFDSDPYFFLFFLPGDTLFQG